MKNARAQLHIQTIFTLHIHLNELQLPPVFSIWLTSCALNHVTLLFRLRNQSSTKPCLFHMAPHPVIRASVATTSAAAATYRRPRRRRRPRRLCRVS